MRRRLGVGLAVFGLVSSARAERITAPSEPGVLTRAGTVPYSTVYVNRCATGCSVTGPATSNSIDNTWNINGTRNLTPFPYDDAAWASVVACIRDVFEPFAIDVVETDPGTANHFEVMMAGKPTDLGLRATLLGVAPGGCTSTYQHNALVFAFAQNVKDTYGYATCGATCIDHLCYVATQELGHTWAAMDHVAIAADPMTYFNHSGRRYFQNTDAQCGSDCTNGYSPDGLVCAGQSHRCLCTTSQTQNSYAIIGNLFGAGTTTPPTVKLSSLAPGQSVQPGFTVVVDATDGGIITRVELVIDGEAVGMLTSPPYVFDAPDSLGNGTHHVEATAYDGHGTPGKAIVDVVIGPPCELDGDCASASDVCIGGRCVAGPEVDGGLGTPCMTATECISGQCVTAGSRSYCGEACTTGQCPSDFGCREVADVSVCWPGFDDGSAGCGCRSNHSGGLALMLLAAGSLRRRRK